MAASSASRSRRARIAFGLALLFLGLTGCEAPPWLPQWLAPPPSGSQSQPSRTPEQAKRLAQIRAELLREMMFVVFMKEPKDLAEFRSYQNVMEQGASLEGIYNGFTHSSDYRTLESMNRGASAEALRDFGEELTALESALPEPTEFDASSAEPLARPVMPDGSEDASPPVARPKPKPVVLSAEEYSKLFVGASIFTLKRVLGDEALKVIASKRDFPGKLALWYSKWVVRIAERHAKVDFGIPQRNKPDEAFHYDWAIGAPEDQLNS
jgi:hypothetical protein